MQNLNLTKDEILEKIKDLQYRRFILDMKDMWDRSDYQADDEMYAELLKLGKLLEEYKEKEVK